MEQERERAVGEQFDLKRAAFGGDGIGPARGQYGQQEGRQEKCDRALALPLHD